jgi:hypothetical protein
MADDIGIHGAMQKIPAFTHDENQLPQRKAEVFKEPSKVRTLSNTWVL